MTESTQNNGFWNQFYLYERDILNNVSNYERLNEDNFRKLYQEIEQLYNETINMCLTLSGAGTDNSIDIDKHIVSSFLTYYAENKVMELPSGPQ
jgi:hypothetical protein